MYIKINGSDERYENNLVPFKTQHGNQGIRVLNGMPSTDKGFKVYNEDGSVFSDFSAYTFTYRENEYTAVADIIEPAQSSYSPLPPSSFDRLNQKVNQLNAEVNEITPYTETKKAYFGEIEKTFYGVPSGILTVNMDGEFTVQKIEDRVTIKFDRLQETKEITIMVQ